jgi:hypothetical protein
MLIQGLPAEMNFAEEPFVWDRTKSLERKRQPTEFGFY